MPSTSRRYRCTLFQRWANDDLRSLNGQIECLLRRALADAKTKLPYKTQSQINAERRTPNGSKGFYTVSCASTISGSTRAPLRSRASR